MSKRLHFLIIFLAAAGLAALDFLQYKLSLGRFAENPQTVQFARGDRTIVGGGRAIVGAVGFNDEQITLEIQCKDTYEQIDIKHDDPTREAPCEIAIRWLGVDVLEGGKRRAMVEVSWD